MLSEIQALDPDLVCLQEVDHWEEVEEGMKQLG
jgi:mRNA deadenylase 3'-5' endonuclease subunit Ccr4